MNNSLKLALILIAVIGCIPAFANGSDCSSILDSAKRLECYDAAASPPPKTTKKKHAVSELKKCTDAKGRVIYTANPKSHSEPLTCKEMVASAPTPVPAPTPTPAQTQRASALENCVMNNRCSDDTMRMLDGVARQINNGR